DKLFSGGGETPLSHDPPAGLAFATSPGNARAGQQLSQVRVAVVDSRGTPVAGADSLITVALGAHPSNAALTGTTSARAANGVATFSDLRIDKPGTRYTLTATVAGLTPDTSEAFDVMPEPMTSSVAVSTTTTGPSPDTDGYTATLDAGPSQPIPPNGSVTFRGLTPDNHSVSLSDVATNCAVSGQNPRTVAVTAGNTTQTNFTITCNPPPNQPPTANFTPDCNGLDCSFTSTSSDPDGTI